MPFKERDTVVDFWSDDPEQATAFLRKQGFGDHHRVLRGSRSFGYRLWAISGHRTAIGRVENRSSQVLRCASPYPMLHLPLQATFNYRIGRRSLTADRGTAVWLAPGHEYTLTSPGGGALATTIAYELLMEELETRLPRRRTRCLLRSVEFPMNSENRGRFLSIRRRLMEAVRATDSAVNQRRILGIERDLAGWLADRIIVASGLEPVSTNGMRRIHGLPEWIDMRLNENITIEFLCRTAGLSERLMQKVCLAVHGMTPLDLVKSRRLAAARRRLLSPDDNARVAVIALDCGFNHLGRFAAIYRRSYGESPSETLARGRELKAASLNI
jgi:AraC-like DNA-binding protein